MKRIAFVFAMVFVIGTVMGQEVVNGVLQGSPSTFMILPTSAPAGGWNNSWVKPSYESSGSGDNFNYTQNMGLRPSSNYSHRFVTSSSIYQSPDNDDCFRNCQNSGSAFNQYIMAPSWYSDTSARLTYVDTVIQMGKQGNYSSSPSGIYAQQIIYSFVPDTNNPVLLLNFTFVTEDAKHYDFDDNPGVEFAVLQHGTNNFLNLGNYDASHPYSRFWFRTPSSQGADDPANTPVDVEPMCCPNINGCPCQSGVNFVFTYPYTIVAYDLSQQARNHQAVDFRVRVHACTSRFHWAYCYFTAKMIPAELKVKYCGGDTLNLSIPWGFNSDSYTWYNGADSASATWFDPNDYESSWIFGKSTTYHPMLKANPAKPYFRCEVVSNTGIPFTYQATVNYYDLKPMFWAEPRATSDSVHKCGYSVLVHNESKIGIIRPNGNGGVDTTWEDLKTHPEQCTWNFGDDTTKYHGFEPEHVYADTGTYIITLTIADNERVCLSTEYTDTVRILKEFKEKHYSRDTVVTCESKLPYYYKPELFGRDEPRTIWNLNNADEDSILVNYSWITRDTIRAWNGCDSIVKVKFDVLTPTVLIQEAAGSDFCDSAQTLLETRVDNVSRTPVFEWTFMDSVMGTGSTLWAMSDGVYSVSIEDTTTGCTAATSYKIDPCVPNIFLPNCITPTTKAAEEGPVQNNYFYLDEFVLRFISEVKFMVYSRDGEQVCYYEGKKGQDGQFFPPTPYANLPSEMNSRLVLWDGSVGGRIVDGTYTYALWIVSGGKSYLYKGRLMVM